jgi:hypothetical protein
LIRSRRDHGIYWFNGFNVILMGYWVEVYGL